MIKLLKAHVEFLWTSPEKFIFIYKDAIDYQDTFALVFFLVSLSKQIRLYSLLLHQGKNARGQTATATSRARWWGPCGRERQLIDDKIGLKLKG